MSYWDRLLAGVLGPALILAGWSAWTGRWRSWAHPYSGQGLSPLAMLPIGIMIMVAVFVDPTRHDLPGWQVAIFFPLALPGVMALVGFGITVFYTPKSFPDFLRPRWLPPDWRPPVFVDARAVGIKAWFGRAFRPSSVELAAEVARGAPTVAHWHAFYEEDDPEVPCLNLGLVGMRWCEIRVYRGLVTIAQVVHEDRLHERPFVVTCTPGEVRALTLIPGERMSWRSIRRRAQFPRLVIETTSQMHRLAFQPRFGRSMASRLKTVERALEVTARR